MCWFDSRSFFCSSYGIHNSSLARNLPPPPAALPAAPLVPPVTSGSFTVLSRAGPPALRCCGPSLQPSLVPTLCLLPSEVYRAWRFKRYLIRLVLLVSVSVDYFLFLFFSLTFSLPSAVPGSSFLPLP